MTIPYSDEPLLSTWSLVRDTFPSVDYDDVPLELFDDLTQNLTCKGQFGKSISYCGKKPDYIIQPWKDGARLTKLRTPLCRRHVERAAVHLLKDNDGIEIKRLRHAT